MVYVALAVFGLACGSFVNALVWRMHEQESSKKKLKDPKLSISKGRSMCPHCHHELAAKDLVPVLSWLSLGGKCRYCKKPISWQYPVVELSTAILFMVAYATWFDSEYIMDGIGYVLLAIYMAVITGLVALFVYDLKWMMLPNRIVFPLIFLASVAQLFEYVNNHFEIYQLVAPALGAFLLGGLFYVLFTVSNGKWIGGGDVKLGILMGILLGPALVYLALLIASLVGSVVILSLMALKIVGRNQQVPFGPFLIAGTYIALIFGSQIVQWYSDNFLAGLL